jgi:hypothetical protein
MSFTKAFLPLLAAGLLAAPASARANDHADVVGTWTWTLPKTGCTMTRTFQADGGTKVLNGQNSFSGAYTVKWNRERTSRMLITNVTADDGGRDCDGSGDSKVGKRFLAYVHVDAAGMLMCLDSAKTSCMGPYRKR